MEEFLNKLYSYEYFGTYLMIAIAVLVLLFIIVLFFGKKDQRKREIEETKKLQQINNVDAFKEESSIANIAVPQTPIQQPVINQETLQNDTIIVPNINNVATNNNDEIPEPILPHVEEAIDTPINNEINNDVNSINSSASMQTENNPVLEKIEDKPLIFNNEPINEPIVTPEPVKPEVPLVDVPDFNFDEIVDNVEEIKNENIVHSNDVFSSVYAPEKEKIELPKIEENKNDDLDIELPTLKKEEKVEMPVFNDYNLDNITGEDYIIKK